MPRVPERFNWYLFIAAGLAVAAMALGVVIQLAEEQRGQIARCPPGLVSMGPRCCAPGQELAQAGCRGAPSSCPGHMRPQINGPRGCVAVPERLPLGGGRLLIAPSDWEAEGRILARDVEVEPFQIDAFETTVALWEACVVAGECPPLQGASEPGRPVTGQSAEQAEEFCAFMGGSLPTVDQWLFAAAGAEGRRYPWGQTGLVCRRAAYGLVDGPCAEGARRPELSGARPDGATPTGIFDLAGNVAEWTKTKDGRYVAQGGSFRSSVAAALKSWSIEQVVQPADWIGFRCVYPSRNP